MRYSEFGKVEIPCKSCNRQTLGFLWHGTANHFLAIYCTHCQRHTTHWLVKRDATCEKANVLIDHWEFFHIPGQTPKVNLGASISKQSQSLFDNQG